MINVLKLFKLEKESLKLACKIRNFIFVFQMIFLDLLFYTFLFKNEADKFPKSLVIMKIELTRGES